MPDVVSTRLELEDGISSKKGGDAYHWQYI